MEEQIIETALNMLTPVIEGAMVAGAAYSKACGRNTVTAMDVKYGLRYCAQKIPGKHIGTLFPELADTDSDTDESDIEEVDENDEPFTRYVGDDETMNEMNKMFDEWDQWEPSSPLEIILKNAVDKLE